MIGEEVFFVIHLSAEEFLRYYQGTAGFIQVQAEDGRRIRLPAGNLRRFVTATGIRGRFRLRFDAQRKIIGLDRIG